MYVKRVDPESIPTEGDHIEIERDRWESSSERTLVTRFATSCLVSAIWNPQTKQGYVGHFFLPVLRSASGYEPFNQMMASIQDEQTESANLEVWLGGASVTDVDKEHDELMAQSRKYAVERLSELALAEGQPFEGWAGPGRELTVASLEPHSGVLRFSTRIFPDLSGRRA